MPKVIDLQAEIASAGLDDPKLYLNRELSLLEFFRRVLEEAQDKANPLLERVKFLAIVGSVLDEFFMVRVAGLKQQIDASVADLSPDGLTPAEQLAAIRKSTSKLLQEARQCLRDDLRPALDEAGIHILDYDALNDTQRARVDEYFTEVVFPVLTPLAFDPGRPFPHISNLSLNLAVLIRDAKGQQRFARVKVPGTLPRLAPIKRSSGGVRKDGTVPHHHYFTWLEQVIAAHLDTLFPGVDIVEAHPFRVTRDADIVIQELEAADLLETIEASVRRRRFGSVVRVTINEGMPAHTREILIENLEMDRNDLYVVDDPLGLSDLMGLYSTERYDLKYPPYVPAIPPALKNKKDDDLFAAIRRGDILLHHPYDSFLPVVDFIRLAARDPNVMAIKMTLYRVGRDSPVLDALLEASQNGKQVAVLVELKARFDEESNIGWAKALEAEGVHVVYGLLGLKTHSKIALVVRKEGDRVRRYIHMATGNYNSVTAQAYTDMGMFTCDEEIGADATDLFNYLTGYSAKQDYHKLLVAPINLRARMEQLILREIEHQRKDKSGHLIFKMNALVDKPIIQLLCLASQAGVKIDLLVRGICCLRPGLPGVSENIRVTSVVGRFLEHSRIFYFYNGGSEEVYLGSADLMPRNIDRRVEILFPVHDPNLIRHLRDDVLATYMADTAKARLLLPDGRYERIQPGGKHAPLDSQEQLLNHKQ
ncbi:MAG TPA: polyphosphate kinase 1 [Anaerolineae bacterium]|nr:polyphosphate kinase 1 [Anaerolineae bacterium]